MPEKKTAKPIHANHRDRMRERVRTAGLESLAEHEALEYLLFYAIPRQDTNPIAHRLIEHFGNFCNVLEADEEELAKVEGVGPAAARMLHAMLGFSRYYALKKRAKRPSLQKTPAAIQYVEPLFLGLNMEVMYLIALDEKFVPLRDIKITEGIPNRVQADLSRMARAAVAAGCTCAILAHNHPHGLAVPSQIDFATTVTVARTLGLLGIDLLDHIIVADGDSVSMRQTGRMPYYDPKNGDVQY
ncbi:MAG: JAB domain-containing protein [Gemmiger sp.]|nr:JAB domain-containing protein [Gemmiger sp.]